MKTSRVRSGMATSAASMRASRAGSTGWGGSAIRAVPILEASEHALDAVAILVAAIIGMSGRLAVESRRNDRQDAAQEQVLAGAVAV